MSSISTNFNNKATDDMYCPITHQLMVNPYIDQEGNTFELEAIMQWLNVNPISPLTRNPLDKNLLRPNRALKNAIDAIRNTLSNEHLVRHTPLSEKCSQEMMDILKVSLDNVKTLMHYNVNSKQFHIKVMVPDSETRAPLHVCLVIDVSGSMGTEATMKGANGQVESHGFSLLDIVRQAGHVVRVTLRDTDTLSIVKYSTNAEVVLEPTNMDSAGKNQAKAILDNLRPEYSTNIWDGLNKALQLCQQNKTEGINDKILLLTDGQPNIVPPRGHQGMLNKYKEQNGSFPASIDTFGFGYNLDSKDLNTISVTSNGNYGFIPDSSMVGDLFSNALANFMATAVSNAKISVELDNGIKLNENTLSVNNNIITTSWGFQLDTGPLYYGQNKDFIVDLIVPDECNVNQSVSATCSYDHFGSTKNETATTLLPFNQESEIQILRLQAVETIYQAFNQMRYGNQDVAKTLVSSFVSTLQQSPFKSNQYIKDLITDLSEQVTIAVTQQDQFTKWGQHYLPSLARAHQQQVCNNFRDPGVQHYGGKLFKKMRDDADEKYNNLPAPTPTAARSQGHYRSYRSSSNSSAPVTLTSYNTHSGPCFTGDSLVRMANGNNKRVDMIKKGDKVFNMKNNSDEIECVLKTRFDTNMTVLVSLESGWTGTPNHPIKHNGTWIHPKSLKDPKMVECDYVYSFLLKNRGTIWINDIESAAFAHDLHDNDVIEHDYFGTEKVVEDFKKMKGWNSGLIEITPECIKRDNKTGYVKSINQKCEEKIKYD